MPDLPAPQLMVGRLSGRPQLAKLRWGRFFALRNHDRKGVQRANEGSGAVEAGDRMAKTDSTLDEIIRGLWKMLPPNSSEWPRFTE
jgi:hypothetical protein